MIEVSEALTPGWSVGICRGGLAVLVPGEQTRADWTYLVPNGCRAQKSGKPRYVQVVGSKVGSWVVRVVVVGWNKIKRMA